MPSPKDTAGLHTPGAADSLDAGGRIDAADSLAAGSTGADSLAARDSLRIPGFGAGIAEKEVWDARAVYGAGSRSVRMVQDTPVRIPVNPVSGNIGLQIITLAAAAAWCLIAYRFRDQVKMCIKGFFKFKSEDKFSAEQGYPYDNLIDYAIPLCAVGTGIFITKAAAAIWPAPASTMPPWVIATLPLAIGAALLIVFLLQCAVIRMAGRLTFSGEFAGAIILNKKLYLTVSAMVVLPLVALYSGLDSAMDATTAYVTVGVAVIVALFFVLRTITLFIRQKVSLLVWILYLCAIEFFPVSLITLLVVKNI